MLNASQSRIARTVAEELAAGGERDLGDEVERELAKDILDQDSDRIVDPISLGGLLISMVSLGWTIYRDIKEDRETAAANAARLANVLVSETRSGVPADAGNSAQIDAMAAAVARAIVAELDDRR